MVLNSNGRNRFITAGRLRTDFQLIMNSSNRSRDLALLPGGTSSAVLNLADVVIRGKLKSKRAYLILAPGCSKANRSNSLPNHFI